MGPIVFSCRSSLVHTSVSRHKASYRNVDIVQRVRKGRYSDSLSGSYMPTYGTLCLVETRSETVQTRGMWKCTIHANPTIIPLQSRGRWWLSVCITASLRDRRLNAVFLERGEEAVAFSSQGHERVSRVREGKCVTLVDAGSCCSTLVVPLIGVFRGSLGERAV